jgi:hypothetical protein
MSRNEDAMLHLNWAKQAEKRGDFLAARMEYLKCVESWKQSGDITELEKATGAYEAFVRRDPVFEKLLSILLPIIPSLIPIPVSYNQRSPNKPSPWIGQHFTITIGR